MCHVRKNRHYHRQLFVCSCHDSTQISLGQCVGDVQLRGKEDTDTGEEALVEFLTHKSSKTFIKVLPDTLNSS